MMSAWKPDGYPPVSPYLIVTGAQRVIDFMQDAFDATPLRRFDADDGTVMHAELRIGDSVIMIGDPDRRGGVRDPGGNTWWIATQVA